MPPAFGLTLINRPPRSADPLHCYRRLSPTPTNGQQSAYFIWIAKDSEQRRRRQQTGTAEGEEGGHPEGVRERATLLREVQGWAAVGPRVGRNPCWTRPTYVVPS